jgi:peroxiredoxin
VARGRRQLWILLALVAAFVLLRARGGELARPALPPPPAAREHAAPDFELARAQGGRAGLAEQRGRVVLLNFWATWCAPCRAELPALQALQRSLAADGLAVVAVSVDAGPSEAVARFAAGRGLDFPVLLDPGEDVARRYGVGAYPTSVVIDRQGRIVHRAPGAFAWDAPESVAWFRALLREGQ